MRRPNPWNSRVGLRIEAAESGARGGKSRGRHLHCVCFSCLQISPFFARPYKRQRLRPQIGRRRRLALIIARRMRTGGTFPRPMFWRESDERRRMLLLLAGQSFFAHSYTKSSAFVHKLGGGAALRFIIARRMRTGGTFPRPIFQWGSDERRLMLHLLASQSFFARPYKKAAPSSTNRSEALLCVYFIARRRRKDGTFPRPRFRWGSDGSRRIRRLCRGRRAAGGSRARR